MNELLQQVQQLVDAGVVTDMNEVTTGGGFKIWPEGNAIARLIWYIETGNHAQKDHKSGVMKAPTPQMKMAFAMLYRRPMRSSHWSSTIVCFSESS